MKDKVYKHIRDCWDAIESCNLLSELEELFECFPRWSGGWDYHIDEDNKTITVINDCYIEQIDEDRHEEREYEFEKFEDISEYVWGD